MIRRVAFGKAIIAGAAGALAWELVARILITAGVPFFDLVYVLGTMTAGRTTTLRWWLMGITMHAAVGAIWAIFYSYFFWSEFNWSPTVQGLVFSLAPAILAGVVMVPQMGFMHELVLHGEMPSPGVFAYRFGWAGPVGIVVGHLIYGMTMGSLYRRPVGFKVRRLVSYG